MTNLPSELSSRAPTMDDAQAVTDLVIANDIKEFGEPDYTLGDLLAEWRRPDFNLATDAWVVVAPDGALVGYTDVWESGGRVQIDPNTSVHRAYRERGIEEFLLAVGEEWARKRVARSGSTVMRHIVNARNPSKVALLINAGYAPVRHDWIMEIEMHDSPPAPRVPEGITLAVFHPERDDHEAFETIEDAFRDVWGHTDGNLEAWKTFITERGYFASEMSFLAREGTQFAGAIMSFDYPNGGWIRQLGVRRAWRQRGLGLALLHQTFGAFYKHGVKRIQLGVDSESLTGATRLYERAGMRVIRQFTRYETTIRARGE
jgi:mycothiol synthase